MFSFAKVAKALAKQEAKREKKMTRKKEWDELYYRLAIATNNLCFTKAKIQPLHPKIQETKRGRGGPNPDRRDKPGQEEHGRLQEEDPSGLPE